MAASLLITLRHAPYGNSLSRAGLDLALAAAAFEQDVAVLLLGDGVLQLLPGQEATGIGLRNQGKTLASLPLYDVETVYADAGALQRHGIPHTALPAIVKPLDTDAIQALLAGSDHLLGF
jgi:tRNA 2-thiouridine synthesizing protein C